MKTHLKKNHIKKTAFTLAEVLITLGIIGIVAAMTIPTLINNSQKEETVAKLKKVYSEFSYVNLDLLKEMGVYSSLGTPYSVADANLIYNAYVAPNLKVVKDCQNTASGCWFSTATKDIWTSCTEDLSSRTDSRYFVLADGTSVVAYLGANGELSIYFALKGLKGPNIEGKDVFALFLKEGKVLPRGYDLSYNDLKTYTEKPGSGCGCQYAMQRILTDSWQIKYY